VELTHADLAGALDAPLAELEALVRRVMERSPAELVADVGEHGLLLYGGGAQLCGLPECLSARLGLRVRMVDDPQLVCVHGAALALGQDASLRKLLLR
jgi:rod shape-determining protein MreB